MSKWIVLLCSAFFFNSNSYAFESTQLTFQATMSCPAYLSKNKKSNPEALFTEPQKIYHVRELNKPNPSWLRLELNDGADVRWVHASCGVVLRNGQDNKSCDIAGGADSHVLALSSQAGFCETYGFEAGKPECRKLSASSYQATHLTLHGLWPNKNACGHHYGYCGVKARANHCDYSPVALADATSEQLKQLMPSYQYGSCLERHEWNKHGSCQQHSADEYFNGAMKWAIEADSSIFGEFLRTYKGQTVALADVRDALDRSFGVDTKKKIYLGCKNNILVDIYLQLPAQLTEGDTLASLIEQAPEHTARDMCGQKVKISQFHKDAWF